MRCCVWGAPQNGILGLCKQKTEEIIVDDLSGLILIGLAIAVLSKGSGKTKEQLKEEKRQLDEEVARQKRIEAHEAEVRRRQERYDLAQERAQKAGCVACPKCLVAVLPNELCSSCGVCGSCPYVELHIRARSRHPTKPRSRGSLRSRPATGSPMSAGRCQPEAGIPHPRPAPLRRSR